ncbi:RNA polymerase sigma-I factor [uncultured Paenibacillus sp.]|uniref:RNA polymerase sigma-I factor n=1 Tax=uncultured Paenibacillus sp. TaxID=227322 RepID=UPI0015B27052|nr:RNA polymerase sigma-I factor [uncultured Paenibacillus sp.]
MDRPINEILHQAQAGNDTERDRLIDHYRPFIIRAVSHVCKRQVGWNQDEASIGMIALNEAIDRYDEASGKSFDNFAYMVIHHRLVDEFRKQGKYTQMESAVWDGRQDEEFAQTPLEIASSLEVYDREQETQALAEELRSYDEALKQYGVALEELESCSPKHRDTRKQLIRMAQTFGEHPQWLNTLKTTKRLPAKEMLSVFKVSSKTLERNRKYLIALILIYACGEFQRIKNTVAFADGEED